MNKDSVSSIKNLWDVESTLQLIDGLWKRNFVDNLWEEKASIKQKCLKNLFKDLDLNGLNVVYNNGREKWLSNKPNGGHCPIDKFVRNVGNMSYELFKRDNSGSGDFVVALNDNPSLEKHLLIVSKKCNPDFTYFDHSSILALSNFSDYTVFINQKGSGAGVPAHLHYQAEFRKYFPLMNVNNKYQESKSEICDKKYVVGYELNTPNKCSCFKYDSLETGNDLVKIIDDVMRSEGVVYNLIYDISGIYLFPRSNEYVSSDKIPKHLGGLELESWRVAGQEMGHLATAKSETVFDRMGYDDLFLFLKETSVDDKLSHHLYDEIIKKI